ncbi:MAG: methionine--tRNA ligase [Planctomycetaceae bacterium]|nr:methionine--tRNA ligase [Planctomycetaceae bacterium]
MSRRILVTAALPYANGPIHIGHLVEYIQTDIWVRFQKLRGNRCLYICADDTHGTAIMIRARQEGRSEEALIADMREQHIRDFSGFDIEFDHYGSTHSEENRRLCAQIWQSVTDAGLVVEKPVEQLYDPQAGTYLADRFVKGICPVCKSPDQYGDHCEKCLSNYTPKELIDPRSTLSGATPELREAPHRFIRLETLHAFLNEWTQSGRHLQPEIANYLKGHFLGDELRDWDVTRPPQYFGFEIPDFPGNYWYVWFDAPIGYIASTWQWCQQNQESLDDWWKSPDCEVHHFIGKDITYFHTLFWPGILKTAGFSLPTFVHIHGFLTVDGEKMSKSRGTFVQAETYLKHLDPSYLRYFFASKLSGKVDDLDLNVDEFKAKVDADLVGKVVNIASRCARFVAGGRLSDVYPADDRLFADAAAAGDRIAALFEACDYNAALREIMVLADRANQYIEANEPWKLRKDETQQDALRDVCTVGLNLFRQIAVYLAPVLPQLARQTATLLNSPIAHWDDAQTPLTGTPVSPFEHMLQRVDPGQVQKMIEDSKSSSPADAPAAVNPQSSSFDDGPEPLQQEPMTDAHCTIDDFIKVDMRVARVIAANHVEGADKLLQLTLSLGGDETRNVFAGIKSVYNPEQLIGRLVICCANLAPRKMRFGTSEGMVLASGSGGQDIYLLSPDSGAKPGMRVH